MMEVAATASTVAIARLVTNITVTGDVQRLSVDDVADNAALTTDFASVTGPASGVDIACTTALSIGVLGGSITAPDGTVTAGQARKTQPSGR